MGWGGVTLIGYFFICWLATPWATGRSRSLFHRFPTSWERQESGQLKCGQGGWGQPGWVVEVTPELALEGREGIRQMEKGGKGIPGSRNGLHRAQEAREDRAGCVRRPDTSWEARGGSTHMECWE